MSHLKYSTYEGEGEYLTNLLGYSQAVRVGDRIEISGQGGWSFKDGELSFPESQLEQIDKAFHNVDRTLKAAGGKGWEQVYRVNSYHTEVSPEVGQRMAENYKKWMPNHKVIWTQLGVAQLGAPEMKVEIEVVAIDAGGADKA
ncbi:l-psp endoribonuclease family [Fusarium longipes]|uniref:L-psp endoribonuclease family n=1 Tax=Fusarium longipes TaxID=694270 RepID=A0A395RUX4_9HYPO|nr:l-psp endoribonuclease family [Fusarium longipes]